MADSTPAPAHHPAVAEMLRYFEYRHLPATLQAVSRPIHDLAHQMADSLQGAQVTYGLDALLKAKDCFVRAALPKDGYPLIPRDSPVPDGTMDVIRREYPPADLEAFKIETGGILR